MRSVEGPIHPPGLPLSRGRRLLPTRLWLPCVGAALLALSLGPACKQGKAGGATRATGTGVKAAPSARDPGSGRASTNRPTGRQAALTRPRRPAFAGSWYPGTRTGLKAALAGYLASVAGRSLPRPTGLIVPHAGYRFSGGVAAHAYATLEGHRYRRVVVLGPSHRAFLHGGGLPSHSHFRTPLGDVPVDTTAVASLARTRLFSINDAAHRREHSLELQMPFLQRVLKRGFRVLPVSIGSASIGDIREMARLLRRLVGPQDLVLASTDFTHYGPNFRYLPFPFGRDAAKKLKALDMGAFKFVRALDLDGLWRYKRRTRITVCGLRAVAVLLAMLPKASKVELLAYDTSGRILAGRGPGSYRNSVSYVAAAFHGAPWPAAVAKPAPPLKKPDPPTQKATVGAQVLDQGQRKEALRVARRVVELCVRQGRCPPNPEEVRFRREGPFLRNYGVFVTLKKHGRLRGCIGNIFPVQPLWKGIMARAVSAAIADPRFPRVRPAELAQLHVEISVLTPPKTVPGPSDIVIGRHGIYLIKGRYRAVYLPQVAPEQGWNLTQTLTHLSRKARLPPNGWRQGATFRVFEAQVFGEK